MLCKINWLHFFCTQSMFSSFTQNQNIFFLLSIFADDLISTLKVITFLPDPVPGNEKLPCLSNPIPYPEYLYLSISAFLFEVTAPNKTMFQCRIIAYVNAFTYLISNVNIYLFSMIECNIILFQTAAIKFYSCFSTIII